MDTYDKFYNIYKKQNKEDVFNNKIKELCEIVMRQTNYTNDKALEELKIHNLNVKNVLRSYLNIPEQSIPKKSTNQEIYSEFRKFLDEASMKYYNKS